MQSHLTVYYGPMFSNKTSTLKQELNHYADLGFKVCYINNLLDNRSGKVGDISTHSSSGAILNPSIHKEACDNLRDAKDLLENYDVFGIDEAQFFTDLMLVKDWLNKYNTNKIFIVVGLDLNAEQNIWGDITKLAAYADKAEKLYAKCSVCLKVHKRIVDAPFTKRTGSVGLNVIITGVDIGGLDKYIPVCRKHHL